MDKMLVEKACALASEMLKQVGFAHLYTSRLSIASYYVWPDWAERAALRIADHKYGGPRREGCFVPVLSSITFREQNYKADAAGVRQVPREHIVRNVARGIGMYFLRVNGVLMAPAAYHGRRSAAFKIEIPGLDDVETNEENPRHQGGVAGGVLNALDRHAGHFLETNTDRKCP